jgi:hypothetical protein
MPRHQLAPKTVYSGNLVAEKGAPDLLDEDVLSELSNRRLLVRHTPGPPSWKLLEIEATFFEPVP